MEWKRTKSVVIKQSFPIQNKLNEKLCAMHLRSHQGGGVEALTSSSQTHNDALGTYFPRENQMGPLKVFECCAKVAGETSYLAVCVYSR